MLRVSTNTDHGYWLLTARNHLTASINHAMRGTCQFFALLAPSRATQLTTVKSKDYLCSSDIILPIKHRKRTKQLSLSSSKLKTYGLRSSGVPRTGRSAWNAQQSLRLLAVVAMATGPRQPAAVRTQPRAESSEAVLSIVSPVAI